MIGKVWEWTQDWYAPHGTRTPFIRDTYTDRDRVESQRATLASSRPVPYRASLPDPPGLKACLGGSFCTLLEDGALGSDAKCPN